MRTFHRLSDGFRSVTFEFGPDHRLNVTVTEQDIDTGPYTGRKLVEQRETARVTSSCADALELARWILLRAGEIEPEFAKLLDAHDHVSDDDDE